MRMSLLSLRAERRVPWFGGLFDAENALAACFRALVHRVEVSSPVYRKGPLASPHVRRVLTSTGLAHPHRIHHDPLSGTEPADVLLVVLNDLHDAAVLLGLPGWERLGEVVVMHCAEINEPELRLYPEVVRHLQRRVDHLFVSMPCGALDGLRAHRLRTTAVVGPLLDVLAFPYRPRAVDRAVDVLNIGRRSPAQHALFKRWAEQSDGFYVFDSGYVSSVRSLADHRRLFTQLTSRSRVFVANYAAFDKGRRGFPTPQIGARFYEGMAGGCVLTGALPTGAPHYATVAAAEPVALDLDADRLPGELLDVLADPAEQERRGRAARVTALREVDVVHRWREMAAHAGLPDSAGVQRRVLRLEAAARAAAAARADGPADRVPAGRYLGGRPSRS
ncbi:MAG TPA: hypothetical protein VD813_01270 [Pseudonocardia sp.]|nr:hypothetical protein [Pseudonocardia sp.]